MAEPLKNQFGPDVPRRIAAMLEDVWPAFDTKAFLADVLPGYGSLELMPRARRIAAAMGRALPADFAEAEKILTASLGSKHARTEGWGMAPFLYLPHVFYVAERGLEHFEPAMRAQYELTQRFTAEFSIRAYLERHPERTLARLREWARDRSPHVRRLVSEGTRPRLPWAKRLPAFQKNPAPVLALLELLKDDPEIYVRRSVANNLNDIGKDHPALLVRVARRWLKGATPEREKLVRHALRSLVKAGERGALAVLGVGASARVGIENVSLSPARLRAGDRLLVAFDVASKAAKTQRVLVDFRIHYRKASGATAPKVFKLKTLTLAAGERRRVGRTVSFADMTTRRHHPGEHRIEALVNGRALEIGRVVFTDK